MDLERNIRINKVLRELNISLERGIDILKLGGFEIEPNPNSKISEFEYNYLVYQINLRNKKVTNYSPQNRENGRALNEVCKEFNISFEKAIKIFDDGNIHVEPTLDVKISKFEHAYLEYRLNIKEKVVISIPQITNPEVANKIRESKGIPSVVYKFFGTEGYHLSSLRDHYLFYAEFSTFNDPFDCNVELIDFQKIGKSKNEKAFENTIIDRFPTIGICCFSRKNNSILMWSHYANNHKGFCIEYYTGNNSHGINPLDVNYTDLFVKANFYKEKQKALFHMIFTKAKQWDYEEELRSINTHFIDFESRKIRFLKEDVKSIYLGVKIEDQLRDKIFTIVKEVYDNKVQIFKGSLSPNTFEIHWEEIKLIM